MTARAERAGGGLRGAFSFALLAAFAALSLAAAVTGARVYRTINDTSERSYASVTAMSYLVGKVRAGDEAGMIEARDIAGVSVLTLGGIYDGKRYNTYIYCDGGQVREYFAAAGQAFDPSYGEAIVEASALTFSLDADLLTIELTDAFGGQNAAALRLAAGGEAAP